MTIVDFIKARLDEDEAWARATGERHWEPVNDEYGPAVRDVNDDDPDARWSREVSYPVWRCDDEDDGCPDAARGWMAEAEHIARHDPARVLREVTASRSVLESLLVYEADLDLEHGSNETPPERIDAVRALAAVWSDHPDYDESWRP